MPLESKIPSEPFPLPSSVEKIPTIRLPAPLFQIEESPRSNRLRQAPPPESPIAFRIPRVWDLDLIRQLPGSDGTLGDFSRS